MARGITAAALAEFTGRVATEQAVIDATAASLVVLDRWWITDPWTDTHNLAQKHVGRWLLQARQGDLVDAGDLGTVFLPTRLPVIDKLLDRKPGLA